MRPLLCTLFLSVGCNADTIQHPLPADVPAVIPTAETEGTRADVDDIAIFVHPTNPDASRIVATQKSDDTVGLLSYDLHGRLVESAASSRLNNVDLRVLQGDDGRELTVLGASNRTDDTLAFYALEPATGALRDLGPGIETDIDVYGFCMGTRPDGTVYAYVNDKDGTILQYALRVRGEALDGTLVRILSVPSQPEGCVVDDAAGRLFVGEENVGIWSFGAWPGGDTAGARIARVGQDDFEADVEGLALYLDGDNGFLVASSQGNSTYAVFDRHPPHDWRGAFRIGPGDGFDAASQSDGIAITSQRASADYPEGLMVAHDTANEGFTGNFKIVDWRDIGDALSL